MRTDERQCGALQRIDGTREPDTGLRTRCLSTKVQADDDGVEDDAEFGEQKRGNLLLERALFGEEPAV